MRGTIPETVLCQRAMRTKPLEPEHRSHVVACVLAAQRAKHGRFDNTVSEIKAVRYEMRRYSTMVDFSAVLIRSNRTLPVFQNNVLKSCKSTLVFLFLLAIINKKRRATIFLTVE